MTPMHRCEELAERLASKGLTLSCAESCTGGLIGGALTSLPGSSGHFMGGAITYSNNSKESLLGVSHKTLIDHGAVSLETADEMVRGVISLFGTDVGVAVTGIAGPGGATEGKPVGLVYVAVSDGSRVVVSKNLFKGSRDEVRSQTVSAAIEMLIDFVDGRLRRQEVRASIPFSRT